MFHPFILLFKARQLRGITKLSSLIPAIDSLFFLLCFLFTFNISNIDRPLRLMDLHLRKLLSSSDDDNSTKASNFWLDFCNKRGGCPVGCSEYCPYDCVVHPRKPKKLLIGISVAVALGVLLFCCYAMYVKYWVIPRSRRRSSEQEQRIETREEFLDEEHGPVVEHHIWHINTVGLQPSVINSIAVCQYNRSDGLVDGTECPVCLNEFQEDESLRLLPKCSHAFHVSCIDTWLRSHTNCPLCRAPIVRNTAVLPTEASSAEETEEAVVEIIESDRAMDGGGNEMRVVELQGKNERDENVDRMQPMRRSVSLDSLSAFKITQALANGQLVGESAGDSGLQRRRPDMEIVPKRGGGDQSLVKFMATSFGRSFQVGPTSLEKSFSCTGELFLSRYYRNRNSVIPS